MKSAISKRGQFRQPRDPQSGQFEQPTAQTDPVLRAFCTRTVNACSHLEPLLQSLAADEKDELRGKLVAMCAMLLQAIRAPLQDQLVVDATNGLRRIGSKRGGRL